MPRTPVSEDSHRCPAMHVLQHRTGPVKGTTARGACAGGGMHAALAHLCAARPVSRCIAQPAAREGSFRTPAPRLRVVKTGLAPRSTGTNSKV